MFNTRFDYLICEYMVYCRSRQLKPKMYIYEQDLLLQIESLYNKHGQVITKETETSSKHEQRNRKIQ